MNIIHESNELEEIQKKCTMLYVGGSETAFRCPECGANVFRKISQTDYECNGCHTVYRASAE